MIYIKYIYSFSWWFCQCWCWCHCHRWWWWWWFNTQTQYKSVYYLFKNLKYSGNFKSYTILRKKHLFIIFCNCRRTKMTSAFHEFCFYFCEFNHLFFLLLPVAYFTKPGRFYLYMLDGYYIKFFLNMDVIILSKIYENQRKNCVKSKMCIKIDWCAQTIKLNKFDQLRWNWTSFQAFFPEIPSNVQQNPPIHIGIFGPSSKKYRIRKQTYFNVNQNLFLCAI